MKFFCHNNERSRCVQCIQNMHCCCAQFYKWWSISAAVRTKFLAINRAYTCENSNRFPALMRKFTIKWNDVLEIITELYVVLCFDQHQQRQDDLIFPAKWKKSLWPIICQMKDDSICVMPTMPYVILFICFFPILKDYAIAMEL